RRSHEVQHHERRRLQGTTSPPLAQGSVRSTQKEWYGERLRAKPGRRRRIPFADSARSRERGKSNECRGLVADRMDSHLIWKNGRRHDRHAGGSAICSPPPQCSEYHLLLKMLQ